MTVGGIHRNCRDRVWVLGSVSVGAAVNGLSLVEIYTWGVREVGPVGMEAHGRCNDRRVLATGVMEGANGIVCVEVEQSRR